MAILILTLLFFKATSVVSFYHHTTGIATKLWSERCDKHDIVLNDCNKCRCIRSKYVCDARNCNLVDKFGHFNDAIKETDVGMEGHGSWRSMDTACEPGVHYKRSGITCVCNEDGNWPNPVCRDIFQVLHPVVVTPYETPNKTQQCDPAQLHLIGCNVCHCPSTGFIDPNLCTKRNCTEEKLEISEDVNTDVDDEVYADCDVNKSYVLGCQPCICLSRNRLVCDVCPSPKDIDNDKVTSLCSNSAPGEYFTVDCNYCYCDNNGLIYCTTKKCSSKHITVSKPDVDFELVPSPVENLNCIPGTKYNKDCNICYCFMDKNVKYFVCSKNSCMYEELSPIFHWEDCVASTSYKVNNLICECRIDAGVKEEICYVQDSVINEENRVGVALSRGYCTPLQHFKKDCNTCRCLADGKTTACTSQICSKDDNQEVTIEVIPFTVNNNYCPRGKVYKVGCNVCYCMANGNTICSTKRCDY